MRLFGATRLFLCFVREQRQDLLRLNSANLHAFHAAAFTAEDSNSGFRRFQKRGEEFETASLARFSMAGA